LASGWPPDFHNNEYRIFASLSHPKAVTVTEENAFAEMFSPYWWEFILSTLWGWQAFRGIEGLTKEKVNSRAKAISSKLKIEFDSKIRPLLLGQQNLSSIEYESIRAFVELATNMKSETDSPVMASKFGHFCAPNLIPVTDQEALGNPGGRNFERYFQIIQGNWNESSEEVKWWQQNFLRWLITQTVKDSAGIFPNFPYITKCAELSLIGRNHGDITSNPHHDFWKKRSREKFVKMRRVFESYRAPANPNLAVVNPGKPNASQAAMENRRRSFGQGMFRVGAEIDPGLYLGLPTEPDQKIYFEIQLSPGQQEGRRNHYGPGQVWVQLKDGEFFRSQGARWEWKE
jgi:hypothetical protein